MAVRLVTYDLNKETVRPKIVDKIKGIGNSWAKLSESSYAIETWKEPRAVFDELAPLLDSNDNLYVITLNRPYYGHGPQDVNKWLAENL